MAVGANGSVFGSGSLGSGHFLVQYDGNGSRSWLVNSASAGGADLATNVVSDGRGGAYWAGSFAGTFNLGTATLNSGTSEGNANTLGYLFNVNSAGNVLWGGQTDGRIRAVAAGSVGNIYLTILFYGSVSFGTTSFVTNAREIFTARLDVTLAPGVSTPPASQSAAIGQSVTLSVAASGTAPFTYQWRKNGATITGATNATLALNNLTVSAAGNYDVLITNGAGVVTSPAATLTVASASQTGRIINLSILTSIASAGDTFTMGYVVGGSGTSGTKSLVIRAAGPSLGALGVGGVLDDPKMEFFAGSNTTGENDNWGGTPNIATAMASVGAFAYLGATSKDAAVLATVPTGDNSVKVSGSGNGTGTVISEIYDATPSTSFTANTPRLVNVSVLKDIGSGLTAGFVIGGSTSLKVLVRAVGPGLVPFGVGGLVADPQLTLFSGQTAIGANDNWGTPAGSSAATAAQLSAAITQVGAFTFPSGSRDASILATLAPGNYTVQVSGVSSTTGVALVEVYEVP